jgi:hypothetical protein
VGSLPCVTKLCMWLHAHTHLPGIALRAAWQIDDFELCVTQTLLFELCVTLQEARRQNTRRERACACSAALAPFATRRERERARSHSTQRAQQACKLKNGIGASLGKQYCRTKAEVPTGTVCSTGSFL